MDKFIDIFNEEICDDSKLTKVNDYINSENIENIDIRGSFLPGYYKLLSKAIMNPNIVSLSINSGVNDATSYAQINELSENLLNSNVTNLTIRNFFNYKNVITITSKLINSSVTHLCLNLEHMDKKKFVPIIESLRNAPITHLDLSHNNFGNNKTAASIAECLKTLPLVRLDLVSCELRTNGINLILESLRPMNKLNLEYNNFIINDIAPALKNNKISSLNTSRNNMSKNDDMNTLSCALTHTCTKRLYLNNCQISGCDTGAFFCSLDSLHLGANNIGNAGIDAIVKSLDNQAITLTCLNMKMNGIDAGGTNNLFANIINRSVITKLNLSYNRIGNEGIAIIAANLGIMSDLNVEYCAMTIASLETLIENVKHSCITKLNLANNVLGYEGGLAINRNLCDTAITNLNLKGCCMGTNIVTEIVANLVNASITHFDCTLNGTFDYPENKAYVQQLKLSIANNYQILKFESKNRKINGYLRRNAKLAKDRRFKIMKSVNAH